MTNDMNSRHDLPEGWVWTTLGEITELVGGGTPSREVPEYFTGDIVWLTPTEISKDRVVTISDSKERITKEALRKSSARIVPKGSVLMTSRASIGYVAIAGTEVTTNQGFASFICSEAVYNGYLAYWLWASREDFINQATGTTFKEITKSKLRPIAFPLAPLPEQQRIVTEIEKQFTRLDAGVAALKRAQANLKRYKATVLKAACEGKLVAQDPSDEPASELLKRILAERRAKWEADLRAKGKDPQKAKYDEPAPLDTEDLPQLPHGWIWATLDQLDQEGRPIIYGIIKPGPHIEDGVPYVRVTEMKDGHINLAELRRTSPARAAKFARATLAAGDVLISKDGTIGRVAVVPPELVGGNITQHVMRAPVHEFLVRDYVVWAIRAPISQRWLTGETRGVALRGVNVEDFRRLPIPLPPLAEQRRIVAEVERRLSVAQELEGTLASNLARAERLRQSILKRAFEGKLVPQIAGEEAA